MELDPLLCSPTKVVKAASQRGAVERDASAPLPSSRLPVVTNRPDCAERCCDEDVGWECHKETVVFTAVQNPLLRVSTEGGAHLL